MLSGLSVDGCLLMAQISQTIYNSLEKILYSVYIFC